MQNPLNLFARVFTIAIIASTMLCACPLFAVPITSGRGPGGVDDVEGTAGLRFWLKADALSLTDGSNVASWTDSTDNATSFSQGTLANQPTYNENVVNGMPVVSFSGAGNELTGSSIVGGFSAGQLFVVMRSPADPADNGTISGGPHNIGAGTYHHPWTDGRVYDGFLSTTRPTPAQPVSTTLGITVDEFHIYNTASGAGGGTGTWESRFNGAQYLIRTNNSISASGGTIIGNSHSSRQWDGDLAEFALFDRVLNVAERILVENALSAKYGVGLLTSAGSSPALEVYAGDTPANGNFDRDVFGIGRVDASNELVNTGAAGFGIEAANGTLGDAEFVLAGHRVASNSLIANDATIRWEREWYVDKTDVDGVDAIFSFDASDADGIGLDGFSLLYRPDELSGFSSLPITGTLNGDTLSFLVPDALLVDGLYTVGVLVPEPSSFALLGLGLFALTRRRYRRAE